MIKQEKKNRQEIWIYLALLIFTLVLLFPVLFSKEASFCIRPDNLHQAYPFFNKLASSLHKGYLPVWDANTYSGKNFSGEFQAGIFYPLNILWCLLFGSKTGIDVYYLDILVALHFFICLMGMYRLASVFKFSQTASIVSTLIFTFTGAVAYRSGGQTCIFFGLTLLPWAIYYIGKYYLVQRSIKYLIFSGLISGMEILAGHIQPFFHTMLISSIVITFYEYTDRKNWKTFFSAISIHSLIILVFALLIALPQIYYGLQYMSQCYRWVGADNPIGPGEKVPLLVFAYKNIIYPSNFFNLLGRDYAQPEDGNMIYMGILPLLILITYFIKNKSINIIREHAQLKKLLIIIFGVGMLSSLGYLTFFYLILYHIPFVNAIRELGRYVILLSFSASLIVGLAVNYISELGKTIFQKAPAIKFYALLFLIINAIYLIAIEKQTTTGKAPIPLNVSIPFLLGFLFFLVLMKSKNNSYIRILVVASILVDLYLNPVNHGSTQSASYPTKFYARNSIINYLEPYYGRYRVTFDMQNDDLRRRNLGDVYNIQTKLGYCATMNKPYFDFISAGWALNSEVNDLLNIRFIITDKTLDSNFNFKDSTKELKLYERKNYYPRIYWKSQIGQSGPVIEEENKESIRQSVYSDLYQKIEVECPGHDTLIISENYYPGWKCYDNQKMTQVFPAPIRNYPPTLRAVALEKGHHILEFKYNKVFYWF
jgi:hypothetical protein